jgi:hypothetical protein
MRPAKSICAARDHPKSDINLINVDQIYLTLRAFLLNYGPRSIFSLECGPPINLSLRPLVLSIINNDQLLQVKIPGRRFFEITIIESDGSFYLIFQGWPDFFAHGPIFKR